MSEGAEQFRDAIRAAGIEPPETIEPDTLQRFPGIGKHNGNTAGWCKLFADGVGGVFGDWAQDFSQTWQANRDKPFTEAERSKFRDRCAKERQARQAEQDQQHAEARKRAAEIWERAQPETGQHRYLRDRGVQAYGIRTDGERLIVPMRDIDGVLHSVQFINPRADKRYLKGGRVSGCYHAIGKPNGTLCVCEGYATAASVHEATGHAVAVAFSASNMKPVARALRAKHPDLRLVICADDDAATGGNPGLAAATAAARAVGGLLAVPSFGAERPADATDFNDLARLRGLDAVAAQIGAVIETASAAFRAIEIAEFLSLEFPPRDYILSPWLPTQGLAMIHAPRGVGKTHVSLDITYAVASGGKLLGWEAPQPRGVLLLDGEMPGRVLQERLALIVAAAEREPAAPLRIVTPDLQPLGMPDISTAEGQAAIDAFTDGIALIVVDNISTLCRSGKENEAEGWLTVQGWALRQRAQGRSILFIHHSPARVAHSAAPASARTCLIPLSAYAGRRITSRRKARSSNCTSRSRADSTAPRPSRSRRTSSKMTADDNAGVCDRSTIRTMSALCK